MNKLLAEFITIRVGGESVNYTVLNGKKEYYNQNRYLLSDDILKNYEMAFEIEYTHNSTAIEGNTHMDLISKNNTNPLELAAWTHAEFVKIHPFIDGNGRTSRLIMNYQLMANGYLPISITKESRLKYFEALERYALQGDIETFAKFIANLENTRLDIYIKAMENCISNKQEDEFEMKM